MRPDHPLLDLVVFDSNQLGDPPQRRLHMSALDNGRRRLFILNANMQELERSLMASEERRWYRNLTRQGLQHFDPVVHEILVSVRDAAVTWLRQELSRPESMLTRNRMTDEEKERTDELRFLLPEEFFRGPDMAQRDVDRHMVAEAAVTNKRLVVSEDENTIRHKPLNSWLKREGWSQASKLLATTDKAHRAFNRLIGPRTVYEWMLGAYLPDVPSMERDEAIIRNNIEQIRLAGLEKSAESIKEELDSDPDILETFARVRRHLPIRTRATEARRLDAVKSAATNAGWAPSS